MVRVGDCLDDGEPQPMATVVVRTGAAQPLEGLEETLDEQPGPNLARQGLERDPAPLRPTPTMV